MDAIKNDKAHNEVEREFKRVWLLLGRMAGHLGTEVSYDQMLNCEHTFGGVEI